MKALLKGIRVVISLPFALVSVVLLFTYVFITVISSLITYGPKRTEYMMKVLVAGANEMKDTMNEIDKELTKND